jgi:hypothetical protein
VCSWQRMVLLHAAQLQRLHLLAELCLLFAGESRCARNLAQTLADLVGLAVTHRAVAYPLLSKLRADIAMQLWSRWTVFNQQVAFGVEGDDVDSTMLTVHKVTAVFFALHTEIADGIV